MGMASVHCLRIISRLQLREGLPGEPWGLEEIQQSQEAECRAENWARSTTEREVWRCAEGPSHCPGEG